jgi:hypothetical protein
MTGGAIGMIGTHVHGSNRSGDPSNGNSRYHPDP